MALFKYLKQETTMLLDKQTRDTTVNFKLVYFMVALGPTEIPLIFPTIWYKAIGMCYSLVKVLEAWLSKHSLLVGSLPQSEHHCLQCLFLSRRGSGGEVYSSQTREGPSEARGREHWRGKRCLKCKARMHSQSQDKSIYF